MHRSREERYHRGRFYFPSYGTILFSSEFTGGMALTQSPELTQPTLFSRWASRIRGDAVLLGTIFGVISALAYTSTNLALRQVAHSPGVDRLDWAIWVSCWKGVPAAVIAWILIAHRSWKGRPALPPRRLVLPLIFTGFLMQFVGNVSFQSALSLGGLALTVPLTFATLIGSSAVLGRVVLGEPITLRSLAAIGVLVVSIAVLSLGAEDATRSTLSESSWLVILGAIVTASLAGLAYGSCGVVIRRTTTGVHQVSLPGTLVLLSTTGVVGLGLTSWLRLGSDVLWQTAPADLASMLGAGCLNAIAFFACGASLMRLSVLRVNLINASQAALCAAGGVLFFGEALTLWLVLGTFLTMAGLMLIDRPAPESPPEEAEPCSAESELIFDIPRIGSETFIASCECHSELPSTNNHGLERAREAELVTPALILAERQTAGRGRGANAWWSSEGALTFSVVLEARRFGLDPEHWPQVSLAVGLAICEAIEPLLPRGGLKLKWPNDVIWGGKKLCGILSEIPSSLKGRIVVGIGLNVNNELARAPEDVQDRAISLRDVTDARHDLTDVLIAILQQMELELGRLRESPLEFSKRFRKRCWLGGRRVSIDNGTERIQGLCQSIDETGALLVQTASGTRRILSGTVTAID